MVLVPEFSECLRIYKLCFLNPTSAHLFFHTFTMSSEIQCSALNNAIRAKGCRFPPKAYRRY